MSASGPSIFNPSALKALLVIGIVAAAFASYILAFEKNTGSVLRAGFFPNVTHAQAVIARQLTRDGKPWFETRLPKGWKLEWAGFTAGPSAMESLITGAVDIIYVGPGPLINIHVRTKGEKVRVLSGAAIGGSALLVPAGSTLAKPEDFRGKRIATPQLGNTQDIACRAWLAAGGLNITTQGGDAFVIPTPNSEQADLLKSGGIDAVWTVEPWVSRIQNITGAKVVVELPEEMTTLLVSSKKTLVGEKRDAAEAFVLAHRELTLWIQDNPGKALDLLHRGLIEEMRARELKKELVASAFARVKLTTKVDFADLDTAMANAHKAGLLTQTSPIAPLRESYHENDGH